MTVKELRHMLGKFPSEMKVVVDQYSDYADAVSCEVVKGVRYEDWIMRAHCTMSAENKDKEEEFLHIGWRNLRWGR